MVHQHIGHFAQDAVDSVAAGRGVVAGDGVVTFEEVQHLRLAVFELGKQSLPQTTRVVRGFGPAGGVARLAGFECAGLLGSPVTRRSHNRLFANRYDRGARYTPASLAVVLSVAT